VAGTAALFAALGVAGWVGAAIDDDQRPATSVTPAASQLATTTTRPAATTTTRAPATTTTTVVLPEVEDIPPVVVYESPPVTAWDSGYEPWDYEPAPCQPSTFGSCDPEEPMQLPVVGCDYLERDFSGDVRCVD
jgi:hypothetical protein